MRILTIIFSNNRSKQPMPTPAQLQIPLKTNFIYYAKFHAFSFTVLKKTK